jgi:hypothetical protein
MRFWRGTRAIGRRFTRGWAGAWEVFRACSRERAGAWLAAATDPGLWRTVQPQVAEVDRRFWRVVVDIAAAALAQVVAGLHAVAVAAVRVVPVGVARSLAGVVARPRAARVQGALRTTSSCANGVSG